jgi:hypothetical protein
VSEECVDVYDKIYALGMRNTEQVKSNLITTCEKANPESEDHKAKCDNTFDKVMHDYTSKYYKDHNKKEPTESKDIEEFNKGINSALSTAFANIDKESKTILEGVNDKLSNVKESLIKNIRSGGAYSNNTVVGELYIMIVGQLTDYIEANFTKTEDQYLSWKAEHIADSTFSWTNASYQVGWLLSRVSDAIVRGFIFILKRPQFMFVIGLTWNHFKKNICMWLGTQFNSITRGWKWLPDWLKFKGFNRMTSREWMWLQTTKASSMLTGICTMLIGNANQSGWLANLTLVGGVFNTIPHFGATFSLIFAAAAKTFPMVMQEYIAFQQMLSGGKEFIKMLSPIDCLITVLEENGGMIEIYVMLNGNKIKWNPPITKVNRFQQTAVAGDTALTNEYGYIATWEEDKEDFKNYHKLVARLCARGLLKSTDILIETQMEKIKKISNEIDEKRRENCGSNVEEFEKSGITTLNKAELEECIADLSRQQIVFESAVLTNEKPPQENAGKKDDKYFSDCSAILKATAQWEWNEALKDAISDVVVNFNNTLSFIIGNTAIVMNAPWYNKVRERLKAIFPDQMTTPGSWPPPIQSYDNILRYFEAYKKKTFIIKPPHQVFVLDPFFLPHDSIDNENYVNLLRGDGGASDFKFACENGWFENFDSGEMKGITGYVMSLFYTPTKTSLKQDKTSLWEEGNETFFTGGSSNKRTIKDKGYIFNRSKTDFNKTIKKR